MPTLEFSLREPKSYQVMYDPEIGKDVKRDISNDPLLLALHLMPILRAYDRTEEPIDVIFKGEFPKEGIDFLRERIDDCAKDKGIKINYITE